MLPAINDFRKFIQIEPHYWLTNESFKFVKYSFLFFQL